MASATVTYVRNPAGFAEVLQFPALQVAVHELAQSVASSVEAEVAGLGADDGNDVIVDDYQADRPGRLWTPRVASSVTIAGPLGRFLEVKYGVLTKAAGANGLTVRSKAPA